MESTTSRLMLGLAIGLLAAASALAGSLAPPPGDEAATAPPLTCFDNTGARFVDCGDGTVRDTETDLNWLKDVGCLGLMRWADASVSAATLAHGQCGLTDGSRPGDWRLATAGCSTGVSCLIADATGEFAALLEPGPLGAPFTGIQTNQRYWSASMDVSMPIEAWSPDLSASVSFAPINKLNIQYVLPVREAPPAVEVAVAGTLEPPPPPGPVAPTHPPDTCFDNTGNRFVDCMDGAIKDTETGLYWLKNAQCFGFRTWADANKDAADLAHGQCGLTDGSLPGDWRLPTLGCPSGASCVGSLATGEWGVILNLASANGCNDPAVPNTQGSGCWSEGDPFSGVQSFSYWSAATLASNPDDAWLAFLGGSSALTGPKTDSGRYVWPVRGDATLPVCGDGAVNPGEQCDAEGESATCDADCTLVECGDGTINATAGEACDDGNTNPLDGCSSTCELESRYVVNGDGTVTDILTGLIWLEDASCADIPFTDPNGEAIFSTANDGAALLANGTCGLTDGSSAGDWRLATAAEWDTKMAAAVTLGCTDSGAEDPPAITNLPGSTCHAAGPQAFTDVQSDGYWSSSGNPSIATRAHLKFGSTDPATGGSVQYVWPVRDP